MARKQAKAVVVVKKPKGATAPKASDPTLRAQMAAAALPGVIAAFGPASVESNQERLAGAVVSVADAVCAALEAEPEAPEELPE